MKQKRNKGFTMAEMLAVVALILILAAVAAVAVYRYRRSMRQLEYDAIAKEIFIVAQNHLTMADNQGLLGRADCDPGTKDGAEEDVWYFVYPDTDPDDTDNPNALGLMLPFGAVDETVRLGGSYVIRYQKNSARVLDVFYSAPGDQTGLLGGLGCSFSGLTQSDYTALKGYRDGETSQKEQRKHYAGKDNSNAVIGWYGGEGLEPAKTLQAPSIRVINAERLWVEVTNPNADKNYAKLQLIITEKGNPQHRKAVLLDAASASSTIILDDITTSGKHFADPDQFPDFTPGADIEIKAVAYSSTVLANIAESPTLTTNSLFASLEKNSVTGTADVANIAYIRHLENLDPSISGFSPYELVNQYEFSAKQTADLNWASFRDDTGNRDICLKKNETGAGIASGSYYPVKPDYRLAEYDGQGHSITGVEINTPEKAGLFAELSKDSRVIPEVKNLELVDFSVTASSGGDAGALIGTSNGVKVTNVLARNSKEKDSKTDATVTTSGNAGGLIGSMTDGSVTNCTAALIVESTGGSAGGLIGSMTGGSVTGSYSGGHTDGNGRYSTTDCNVTGVTAGGLIGTSSATITKCYSTCSAKGTSAAGGLIGNSGGSTVSHCYATGLVDAPDGSAGALVGSGTVTDNGGNKYLWIINQDQEWHKKAAEQLKQSGGDEALLFAGFAGAVDVTASTDAYKDFFIGSDPARPYDAKLIASYKGEYPMLSIKGLDGSVESGDYVAAHYGDWPMPETLVINN